MVAEEVSEVLTEVSAPATAPPRVQRNRARLNLLWLLAVLVVFCGFAMRLVFTSRPLCDEGWFASIVYNVINRGVMGLTVLDPHGFVFDPHVKAIDRYTYWILPNYILLQAAWCSLAGLNLHTFRILSVASGCVGICCWYLIVARLTHNRAVGLLAAALLALDQQFIRAGAFARMDMMCSALNLAASALYLHLRSRFHLAVFLSCSVLALALLTHPNAVFGFVLLALIILSLDRKLVRWQTIAVAAAPFIVAAGVWGVYVLRAPDIFLAQMRAQSKIPHRFEFHWNLIQQFTHELNTRFASAYRLRSELISVRMTGSIVFLYLAAVVALIAARPVRERPGSKLILLLALLSFTHLSCLQRSWYYLVYVLPSLAAALAICIVWLWERRSSASRIAVFGVAIFVVLKVGLFGYRIVQDVSRDSYTTAIQFLRSRARANDVVMGSGDLAFGLGFDGRVIDDCRLGFYTGKRPEYIVLDLQYYAMWMPYLAVHEPQAFRHLRKLLSEDYEIVYDQKFTPQVSKGRDPPHVIYRLRNDSEEKQSAQGVTGVYRSAIRNVR